jgi:hypothetical protein
MPQVSPPARLGGVLGITIYTIANVEATPETSCYFE